MMALLPAEAVQSAEFGLEDACCGVAAANSGGDGGEQARDQAGSDDDEKEPRYWYELVGTQVSRLG
jgi:hypothetical protein